jgi:hypothetical protein
MARKRKNWRKHLEKQRRIARYEASIEAEVIEAHESGNGAAIMAAVARAGDITWTLVRTWDGDRVLERRLKDRHNSPKLCAICTGTDREREYVT